MAGFEPATPSSRTRGSRRTSLNYRWFLVAVWVMFVLDPDPTISGEAVAESSVYELRFDAALMPHQASSDVAERNNLSFAHHLYRRVPEPAQVCEPDANSLSNLALTDQLELSHSSAPAEVSAEFCGMGAPLTVKLAPGSA